MQRASETIGKIAAALARAQRQLQNPQKTLSATIASPFPREGMVSFRYASLAQGLDIVRKALGEQEIAALQRTEIDRELGLIRLNTMLAHSSGEWISSDWPVCATTEVAAPHRLGAALTYARRYALFALVGITGEDDFDAPDLPITPQPATIAPAAPGLSGRSLHRTKLYSVPKSEEVRRKLLAELETIQTPDDLLLWTLRRLPLKSRLQLEDARLVEAAYLARLKQPGDDQEPQTSRGHQRALVARPPMATEAPDGIVVTLPKTVRKRDKAHLAFISSQPCLVCRRTPSDAHHLKFAQPRALGRKVSDEFTVPLCREHHHELHQVGNERSWWANVGIEPVARAQALWNSSERGRLTDELPT